MILDVMAKQCLAVQRHGRKTVGFSIEGVCMYVVMMLHVTAPYPPLKSLHF